MSIDTGRTESNPVHDAADLIRRALDLNGIAFLATEGISNERARGAFETCLDEINTMLIEAKAILCANIIKGGGAK